MQNIAWVVMPDHIHWMFELRHGTLQALMRQMKSRSARLIRSSRGDRGPVWQPGYYDHLVRAEEDLRAQAFYIVDNPVRSRLVSTGATFEHAWCLYPMS